MGRNFSFKWAILWGEGEESGRSIAALSELEALTSLTTLEIQVPDSSAIPMNMHLSSKLTKYAISVRDLMPKNVEKRFHQAMYLFLPTMSPLANWIQVALRGTEYLNLTGEGSMNAVKALVPDGFQHVKVLKIHNCDVLEYLVNNTVHWFMPGATIFLSLESLDLCNLASLQRLCHVQLPLGSFSRLKELKVDFLDSLENLLVGTTGEGSLAMSNLRSICISRCRRLQYLFPHSTLVGLLHLEELQIFSPEVVSFSERKSRGWNAHSLIAPCSARIKLILQETKNLAIRVEESSHSPTYLAIQFLNLAVQTQIVAVDVAHVGSQNWNFMSRKNEEGGAIWETNSVPNGPLQFRVVVTAGLDGKWYWASKVMPEDWKSGEIYDTGLCIADIAIDTYSSFEL